SVNTVDSRQAATRLIRTGVSPAAAASLVCKSTHQPHPLIWLARSDTSSCVDFGNLEWWITRLALANRFANLAPISLGIMSILGSMTASSLLMCNDRHEMPAIPSL